MPRQRTISGLRATLLGVAAMLACAGPAGAITSLSDDFSGYGNATVLNAPDALFGGVWQTVGHPAETVDFIATGGFGGFVCRGDAACIDLDGSTDDAGVFQTVELFEPGDYLLSFRIYGSSRGQAEDVVVTLGDYSELFPGIQSDGEVDLAGIAVTVGAGGSRLSFDDISFDNVGAVLTSVSVTPASGEIPAPAGGGLLATALAGLLLLRARRRG
jgi:hypothetical protein